MRALIFILIFLITPHHILADCVNLLPLKCVKFKASEATPIKGTESCLSTVLILPGNTKHEVYFEERCPNKNDVLIGNLTQRPDITIDGYASCTYEFTQEMGCHK